VFYRGRVSEIEKSEPRPETAEHVRGEQLLSGHRRPTDRTRGRPVGDLDLRSRASGTILYRQSPRRPEQQVLRLRLATPVQPERVGPIQSPRAEHRFHVPAGLARTMVAGEAVIGWWPRTRLCILLFYRRLPILLLQWKVP